MHSKKIALSLLTSFALSSLLSGDVIEFFNGAVVEGYVVHQNSERLTINVNGKVSTYSKEDIQKINLEQRKVSPAPSPTVSASDASRKSSTYDMLYSDRGSFTVADTEAGALNIGIWTYARYENQTGIDTAYVDEAGEEKEATQHLRNDIYINKVNIQFKGWLFDERFKYLTFVWTSNSKYTKGGNIAIVGSMSYDLTPTLKIGVGMQGLPTTREMELVHPRLNRVDMRTMAGEFFRGSFAYGVWVEGEVTDSVYFRSMLGNNMNAVGVQYDQLDDKIDTLSTGMWWMSDASKSEEVYGGAFGDYENHQRPAFRTGIHYTHSTETRQGQADEDAIENSQIRLSGGTPIFQSSIFNTSTGGGVHAPESDSKNLDSLRYQMVAVDAGVKYKGFALEGELYFRYLDKFKLLSDVDLGFNSLIDTGFTIQPSYMVIPKKLQLYAELSQIYSDRFHNPRSSVIGFNWYPIDRDGYGHQVRVNADVQYTDQAAVGGTSVPYVLHGTGFVYTANVEYWF